MPLLNIKSPYKIGDAFKVGTTIMAHQDRIIKVGVSTNSSAKLFGIPVAFGNDTKDQIFFMSDESVIL